MVLPRARRYREIRREPRPLGGRTVLERIVGLSIRQRWFVLAIVGLLCALGVWSAFRLPVDAVPDITNVQVQINTEAEGYSPLESEQRITFPIRSEEHTSELQSLMRNSYAVFCLKKKNKI